MTFAASHGTASVVESWRPFARMRLKYGHAAAVRATGPYSSVPRSISEATFIPRPSGSSHMSSASCNRLPRMSRMTGPGPQHQLWHVSRGIVFAKGSHVVYPRLPLAGYHSSPDLLGDREDLNSLASGVADLSLQSNVRSDPTIVHGEENKGRAKSVPYAGSQTTEAKVLDTATATGETGDGRSRLVGEDSAHGTQRFTPLDFKIPEHVFHEAKRNQAFWSYDLYRGPGDDGAADRKIKVHYCKSKHTTERVLQQYFMDEKLLGFDLEWASDATKLHSARRNVSLVQIASQDRIALFHLALYPKGDDLVAPSLKKIMEDPEITKVGVCIKGDCTRLRNFLGIDSHGIFELSHLYKLVKYSTTKEYGAINRRTVGLAAQVQECLGLPMFKGQDVRASDWSQPIGLRQLEYSASDAYAAVQIYAVLDHQRQQLDPMPPLPLHAELNRPISLAYGVVIPPPDETLEPEGEPILLPSNPPPDRSLGQSGIKVEEDAGPRDARTVEAEEWLKEYQSRKAICSAFPGSLRAYHIWHHNADLTPEAVAKLLRRPPLQTATVVNYILEAIRLEKLQYDPKRLGGEVLSFFPRGALPRRYKHLASSCKAGHGHIDG